MPAFTLKTYQTQALDSLGRWLSGARDSGSLALVSAAEMARQTAILEQSLSALQTREIIR
jgi:hypothetical protein